ncbi:DUF1302 family protein [uncultured Treponema sp.]|uniref:DUF1302 family protein n=1 Tax=uncultured Treponema sp. TaxID=162155 RepID=UPI0025DE6EFF|nr:DUF1302 family protein [uncultured Treponema sp.]
MKKFCFFLTLAFSLSLFAEENIRFSGNVETLWGAGLPWTDRNTARGRMNLGETSFTGKIDSYFGNSSALVEGSAKYDSIEDSEDFSLSECWMDYTADFWGMRIGRQKTAWGKADGIDITNVICPKDLSSLAVMTTNEKLAIDALRFSVNGNQFTADAYWIPFFTPAKLSDAKFEKPESKLSNGEGGLKLSGYFSVLDFSFYGFYGWDDMPFLDYTMSSEGVNVTGEYKRMAMFGIDAAVPIKETVLRMEAAFFPKRHFQKSSGIIIEEKMLSAEKLSSASIESSLQRNELFALAGLDWMRDGWTFTAQYYCDYVLGELENLEREKALQQGATLSVSKKLLSDTLELSFSGVVGLNDFDSFIEPDVTYSLSDQINLSGGAYVFIPGPERDGQYGAYKDLSTGYVRCKFSF